MALKSLDDLAKIREKAQAMLRLRNAAEDSTRIVVCMGTCGLAAGARETLQAIMEELSKRNRTDVIVTQTDCIGLCVYEPIVDVIVSGQSRVRYGRINAERARQIIDSHIMNGRVIQEWVVPDRNA